ncbi:hypothetical protein GCM10022290_24450 [Sagittula marina]
MLNFVKILALVALAGPASSETRVVFGPAEVLDAGHLRVRGQVFKLSGIWAPAVNHQCDHGWACGAWAAGEVAARYDGRDVLCVEMKPEINEVTEAVCLDGRREIGADLVASGLAFAPAQGPYGREVARSRRVGAGLRALGVHGTSQVHPPRKAQPRIQSAKMTP